MSREIESGALLHGVVLPGSDWIVRDPDAWWDPDDADAPAREVWPVTQFWAHWTGGRSHTGFEAARRVVRAMKARRRPDGSLMDVSVHLVASADGVVTQVMDFGRKGIHAGRVANRRSIAIEICWPGYATQAMKLGEMLGQTMQRRVDGSVITVARPPEPAIAAVVRLAEWLASLPESTGIRIPRVVAPSRRLHPVEARRGVGAFEHASSPGSEKDDCAFLVLDELAARGWRRTG